MRTQKCEHAVFSGVAQEDCMDGTCLHLYLLNPSFWYFSQMFSSVGLLRFSRERSRRRTWQYPSRDTRSYCSMTPETSIPLGETAPGGDHTGLCSALWPGRRLFSLCITPQQADDRTLGAQSSLCSSKIRIHQQKGA